MDHANRHAGESDLGHGGWCLHNMHICRKCQVEAALIKVIRQVVVLLERARRTAHPFHNLSPCTPRGLRECPQQTQVDLEAGQGTAGQTSECS